MTTQLTAVNAGEIAVGDANTQGSATAITAAVTAVNNTMAEITNLKEAEGLSDTVVDAIGILENAWNELREVRLGGDGANGTTVGGIATAEEATEITRVTQEQILDKNYNIIYFSKL